MFFCVYGACFEKEENLIKIMPADTGNYPILYIKPDEKKLIIRFVDGEAVIKLSDQDIANIIDAIQQQYKAYKRIYG